MRVKPAKEQERKREFNDCRDHRHSADPFVIVIAQEQKRQRARDRQKRQDRE
jgi:hypothetical protein